MHIPDLASQAEFSDAGPNKKVLYETPELTSILISLKGGQNIPAHTLASEVIMHVVSGEGSFYTGSGTPEVKEGSLVVCGPNEPHGIMAKTDMVVLVAKVAGR
jgi:quercetin dioxygenase-like cupin family protein